MSTLSIKILPVLYSKILNKARAKLLFPAPVRPTIPIFSPGFIVISTLFKTLSSVFLYLTEYCSNTIFPLSGQFTLGVFDETHSLFKISKELLKISKIS